jgi:hypothetical protein
MSDDENKTEEQIAVGELPDDAPCPEQQTAVRLMIVSIPLLLLIACLLVLGISRSFPQRNADAPPTPEEENPLVACDHSMPLPFGMKARNQCVASCYAPGVNRDLCIIGCDKLIVADFARHVAPEELDPITIAGDISRACSENAKASGKQQPFLDWSQAAKAAVQTLSNTQAEIPLYEYAAALAHYRTFKDLEPSAVKPQTEDPAARDMSEQLQTTLCLRESIAATQMAITEVSASFDFFSEKFYRRLEDSLIEIERATEVIVMNEYSHVLLPPPAE